MSSTQSNNLIGALLAVQGEAPKLQRSAINPAFRSKYVTLDSLMEAILPVLNKNGLVWTALPCRDEGEPALNYRLVHAPTGEALEGTMPLMLAKSDPQGQGSALTYARRYSIMAVLGLVADEDDDGNQASRPTARRQGTNGNGTPAVTARPAQGAPRPATPKQRGLINAKASEAELDPMTLANIILHATGNEPREFDDFEAAERWLKPAMDRLPGKAVDGILEGIAKAAQS